MENEGFFPGLDSGNERTATARGRTRLRKFHRKKKQELKDTVKSLSAAEGKGKTVEKTVEKIINAIRENPKITQKELEDITGLTRRGVEWNLRKLKVEGRLRRVGPAKGGHWEVKL